MFCPNCGRDNSNELKFCASCGTDLLAVSRALTGRGDDVVTRLDAGLDQFISRYTDHIFSDSKASPSEHPVVRSWRILGQGFVTSLIDVFMFILMWNILPARFMLLLVTSPVRLLLEKNRQQDAPRSDYASPELEGPRKGLLLDRGVPSVTEGTTTNLGRRSRKRVKVPTTDKLE